MPFITKDNITYYQFEIFKDFNIDHAVFARRGGISSAPFDELNMGSTVGDDQNNVDENRRRSFAVIEREVDSMYDSWLVHGTNTLIADEPAIPSIKEPRPGDIILSDNAQVTLFMRYADCVPILLYDPENHVTGLVHAGWKGTLERVAAVAVDNLKNMFGTKPKNLLAAIGPSIAAHHYEVGAEVIEHVQRVFGEDSDEHLKRFNGSTHFDLWSANIAILNEAGVHQIENPEFCTACNLDDWYSHRGEHGKTGRFGVLLGLREA